VRKMAGVANLSVGRFSHLFRAETGCSPSQFLRHARVLRAALLLGQKHLLIKQVASIVGASSVSALIRDFRRLFRLTPGQMRAAHLADLNGIHTDSSFKS
jgi:two-component system, response regulator YesN